MKKSRKPWSGRFTESTHSMVEEFTASIHFDQRLYRYDIEGSIAHCEMLAKKRIISADEKKLIIEGLKGILSDMEGGDFEYSPDLEDIHMVVEKALIDRIGDVGGKLHTGRSRNDQVSLDVRLYLRDETKGVLKLLKGLKKTILKVAKREADVIMPGYTHLQKAQPVCLSHYLLAFWEMIARDEERFEECYGRINVMPLGSAALAGTSVPIDRNYVAKRLKFPKITKNSMDAVSDRDFVAEFIFDAGLLMMHMSRLCEDLILWSSDEFGFVEISDSFTTGSSIMPQKKNPDVAELIRGKTGRIYGNLVSILTVMKGLPMTYNRDLQEDKEPLFDTVDTVKLSLGVLAEMMKRLKFKREKMISEAVKGFSTATDIAEYLVMKGMPFREAHKTVGSLVLYCIEKGKDLASLEIEEIRRFYKDADEDIYRSMDVKSSVDSRNIPGGTGRTMVLKRIEEIEAENL